ncbi:helix-turn-helix transcriptional regulator [Desulfococcus sp.]|uniref:helix-turn-helix transcriptional regulator n=1 Tax=Desulfococcus sp. TaxID=2025834 RepID=UPI0035948369
MNETKDSVKFDRNLAFLKEVYPGRVYVNVAEFAAIFATTKKTVYNWIYLGKCPVKPKRVGSRPLWALTDIAKKL